MKKAFEDLPTLSEIVHFPLDLLEDLKLIFDALDCWFMVDWKKFQAFTSNWLDRFHASEQNWNILCPTLHFIMHHGWEIIRDLPVPPGMLSEEGSESSNRFFRYNREHQARQCSLEKNLLDIFQR